MSPARGVGLLFATPRPARPRKKCWRAATLRFDRSMLTARVIQTRQGLALLPRIDLAELAREFSPRDRRHRGRDIGISSLLLVPRSS